MHEILLGFQSRELETSGNQRLIENNVCPFHGIHTMANQKVYAIPFWLGSPAGLAQRPSTTSIIPPPAAPALHGPWCREGPSACSHYPGGISADSPGSRSAPRGHVESENNPGGVEASAAFAPLRGADSITTPLSPGACFARPGAIGSHPSGMPSRRRRGSGSGSNGTRRSPKATRTSPPRSVGDQDRTSPGIDSDGDSDPDTEKDGGAPPHFKTGTEPAR
jgi:hypothetical protein